MHKSITRTRSIRSNRNWSVLLLISIGLIALTPAADAQSYREHLREAQYDHPRYERGYERHRHGHRQHRRSDWHAEQRDRAHRYALRAVEQAREARWYGYDFNHPRWSTNYRRHFRWALDASRKELRRELRKRERRLRDIRIESYGYSDRRRHRYERQYPH